MNTSHAKAPPHARAIAFTDDAMVVYLQDGRSVSVPLEWFPTLRDATAKQRAGWSLIGHGVGIHWEELDEDISVRALLAPEDIIQFDLTA